MSISTKILSDITVFSKYAKYVPSLKRRETWEEIVYRNYAMHVEKFPELEAEIIDAYSYVMDKKVLPSMRSMQFGGKPIAINNARLFNCCFFHLNDYRAFGEGMFLLLSGCGVGFSSQKHHVEKLPEIHTPTKKRKYLINDSIIGWADSINVLYKAYMFGKPLPDFDYREIRPKGAALITAGGKAPGPEPLKDCHHNLIKIFNKAIAERGNGTKLTTLDVYDQICFIADAVLSGGIRRCLLGTDEVITSKGMKKISELIPGADFVLTHDGSYKCVVDKEMTGKKKVTKIKTNIGYMTSTPEHRWAVASDIEGSFEWVETQNLEIGDRLIFNNNIVKGEYQNFPKDELYDMPDLDTEMAWFVGYFLGNGSCSIRMRKEGFNDCKTRVIAPTCYPEIVEKMTRAFERIVGKYSIYNRDTSIELTKSEGRLAEYFQKYIKKANSVITIPSFIKENTKEIRLAFISGLLDSDGSIKNGGTKTKNTQIVLLSSKYESFIREVHSLISTFGIPTKYRSKVREGKSTEHLLTTISQKYANKLVNFLKPYSCKLSDFDLDVSIVDRYSLSYGVMLAEKSNAFKDKRNNSIREYETHTAKEISFIPITIEALEENYDEDDVWDIEVEGNHNFFANGILSHNSATIAIFSYDDDDMMTCKYDNWYETNPQRARSNNSVMLVKHKLTQKTFFDLWEKIQASGSGEPGFIISNNAEYGFNPCVEASLEDCTFCNLTTIDASSVETQEDFEARCRAATFIGTLQATYTDFHFLREKWKHNCEKKPLLGVSMTGIASTKFLSLDIKSGAKVCVEENKRVANLVGIKPALRICNVKPEGTVSCIVGSSSGIHAWHSEYYIRRIRVGKNEALYRYLIENHPEIIEDEFFKPKEMAVVSLPMKAPEGAILRNESPIDLLNRVKRIHEEWIKPSHIKGDNTHNVSCTVSLKDEDWEPVGKWMWDNKEHYSGLSIVPYYGGSHKQLPFEDITEEKYHELMSHIHDIDLTKVIEDNDDTSHSLESACAGGGCELK